MGDGQLPGVNANPLAFGSSCGTHMHFHPRALTSGCPPAFFAQVASSAQGGRGDYGSVNQNGNAANGSANGSSGGGSLDGGDAYIQDDMDGFGDLDQELDEVNFPDHTTKL